MSNAYELSTVAVIGAGTMGAGISGEFARVGFKVRLVDVSEEVLQQGMRRMSEAQQALVDAGLVSPDEADAAAGRVRATSRLEDGCEGAELIVEALPEDLQLKRELFGRLDRLCSEGAIFATNTSGLPISEIAKATGRPELVVGMHFWNPPHIVWLVEVTRGDATSDATAELLLAVCRRLGKRPILVRHDIPGFVGNRLQFAVMREALSLLEKGVASAEDIDTAMTAGPGLRYGFLGPLRTADLGGLDIFLAISSYLFAELDSSTGPPRVLADLVGQAKMGAKAGEGIYPYAKEDLARFLAQRDRVLLGFLEVLKREEGV